MKIGIIIFHRATNYGATLQAYALVSYFKSLGHETEIIDRHHQEYGRFFTAR